MRNKFKVLIASLCCVLFLSASLAQTVAHEPLLSVKEIMNAIITPTTATIWGAYQLQTDTQWQEVRNAALSVIAAGNLLQLGGTGVTEKEMSVESDWRSFNQQMIAAARQVIAAVEQKDEEALSAAGNDALYPPCESCHQQYQNR